LYKEAKMGSDVATVELIISYNLDINEIQDIEIFKKILDSVKFE